VLYPQSEFLSRGEVATTIRRLRNNKTVCPDRIRQLRDFEMLVFDTPAKGSSAVEFEVHLVRGMGVRYADGLTALSRQANRLREIAVIGNHERDIETRREVADERDAVLRMHKLRAERQQIEPTIRRALESAVIEVESVDVDRSAHEFHPWKSQGPHVGALYPPTEVERGVTSRMLDVRSDDYKIKR